MIITGDCLDKLKELPENSVDAIVTDPPYGLSFMGKKWDYDVPSKEVWVECLRVLKPGGYLLSFAGTRTQHRMAVNIEDAGFEIRDMIAWVYGSGFPKSLNIGKAVDKLQGNEREILDIKEHTWNQENNSTESSKNGQGGTRRGLLKDEQYAVTKGNSEWEGWGTALKPALEPITVARKPLAEKTVAENVLKWGTGGINIDGSRVGTEGGTRGQDYDKTGLFGMGGKATITALDAGRFPANLIHDGSDEVVSLFPNTKSSQSMRGAGGGGDKVQQLNYRENSLRGHNDSGSAARFFKQCELTEEDLCHQDQLQNNAKFVETESGSQDKHIVQELVRTKNLDSKTETLPAFQDSIGNSNDYSPIQNPVQNVGIKENTDTTQTIQNLSKSSGSVHHVIDVPINQVNPNSDSVPKRFLYQPKASKSDRDEGLEEFEIKRPDTRTSTGMGSFEEKGVQPGRNNHPTVKPTKLMQYLVKLVTPKGGVVLDPFMGSGSTGKACKLEGFKFIGIEREPEYVKIAEARIANG